MKPFLLSPALAAPDVEIRDRLLTPVTSAYIRELTAKMMIPNSRIRLFDTLGHGMKCKQLAQVMIAGL